MYRLYTDRDVPLTRVAEAFGVPVSTLLRWVAEMDWPRRSTLAPAPAAAPSTEGAAPAPLDLEKLRLDVAARARVRLAEMGDITGPMTPEQRERDARVIASLARSIERLDNGFDARVAREALERDNDRLRAGEAAEDDFDAEMEKAQSLVLQLITQELTRYAAARRAS